MKATITRQYTESVDGHAERSCFEFKLDNDGEIIWSDTVTLKTAHVLLLKFAQHQALAKLFVAITHCNPDDYTLLIRQSFEENERTSEH